MIMKNSTVLNWTNNQRNNEPQQKYLLETVNSKIARFWSGGLPDFADVQLRT